MPANWSFKTDAIEVAAEKGESKQSIITATMKAFTVDFGQELMRQGVKIQDGDKAVVGYDESLDCWFVLFKGHFFTVMLNRDILMSSSSKTPFYFSPSHPNDIPSFKGVILANPPRKEFPERKILLKKELMN